MLWPTALFLKILSWKCKHAGALQERHLFISALTQTAGRKLLAHLTPAKTLWKALENVGPQSQGESCCLHFSATISTSSLKFISDDFLSAKPRSLYILCLLLALRMIQSAAGSFFEGDWPRSKFNQRINHDERGLGFEDFIKTLDAALPEAIAPGLSAVRASAKLALFPLNSGILQKSTWLVYFSNCLASLLSSDMMSCHLCSASGPVGLRVGGSDVS